MCPLKSTGRGVTIQINGKMLLQTTDPETGEYILMVYRIIPAVEGLEYP